MNRMSAATSRRHGNGPVVRRRHAVLSTALLCAALAACNAGAPAADVAQAAPSAGAATPASASPPAASATPADAAPGPRADAFVLPGVIDAAATLATLRAAYGAANVVPGEVPGAEGETAQGAMLFPDDPARRATVYLEGERVDSVRVSDPGSRWALADGITVGMPLSELVRRNGKPIVFSGMDWDYGGTISSWNGGALDPARSPGTWRSIRLGTRADIGNRPYPLGDEEFSSTDAKFPALGTDLVVGEIGVSFDHGEGENKQDAAPGGDG